jgi:outer membrane protein assembly factor BamB
MKLQCPCGAKYAFDLLPEMVQNPVTFVCPTCGLDSSEFVNQMVRQEFGVPEPEYTLPISTPPPAAPAPVSRLKISHHEKPAEPTTETEAAPVSKYCQKHRGVLATEKCTLCEKPICPKCMELFGYFCSPLCQNKADMQGIEAPVYAGQKFQVERQFWRKAGSIFAACLLLVGAFFGTWVWYAWFGSVPHKYFAVRFEDDDRAYAGKSQLVGKDQLVFLHGGTLARCDLKSKKTVWSVELVSKADIAAAFKAAQEADAKSNEGGGYQHHQSQESMEREVKIWLQRELLLRVAGENIWVGKGNKLTRYDWATGKVAGETTLPESGDTLVEKDGELLMLGAASVTHISLANGESRVEQFHPPGAKTTIASAARAGNSASGGLFSTDGQPLDPNKVANQAANLKLPARTALPALLANAQHEAQLEAALRDSDPKHPRPAASRMTAESFDLVPGANGFVQFSKKLLEEKFTERSAMKAAPKKSALEGEVNAAATGAIANEMLNEMQRNAGGGTVVEDESRYQVTVHLPDAPEAADWTGEVTGPPQLFVLKTVNVIAAGKGVVVLDKANKKIWSATLTYPVGGGGLENLFRGEAQFGEGPCVEHGDTLYVFDQAVLSAFALSNGDARWRVPSVGVAGLFFDEVGNIYVNTTSGNPDDLKFSRQIDITKQTDDVLMKLEPKTGKTLWSIKPGGFISYLHGKYIYTTQAYDPNPTDEEQMSDMAIQKPAYFRIARINPKNGRLMWEYFDQLERCPMDVRFQDNAITLVFKREVQLLKYLAF